MEGNEVRGWVWSRNVQTLLFWAAHYVGYAFDEWDWQAVESGMQETDDDRQDGWYEYPLTGTPPLQVLLARSVGADPVQARFIGAFDGILAARLETLLDTLSDSERQPLDLMVRDARVLGQALNEVLHGPEAIEDWEFQTRMGLTRDGARSLLARLSAGLPPLTPEDD